MCTPKDIGLFAQNFVQIGHETVNKKLAGKRKSQPTKKCRPNKLAKFGTGFDMAVSGDRQGTCETQGCGKWRQRSLKLKIGPNYYLRQQQGGQMATLLVGPNK